MTRFINSTILIIFLFQPALGQLRHLPAYPLITHDTYFSVWSFTDDLSSDTTRHWTGKPQPLLGFLKVDGHLYRFMGSRGTNDTAASAEQQWVSVLATQTKYQFACGGVDLTLTFTSPLLLTDLSLLSRPVSYVSFRLRSNDGAPHTAQLEFDVAGALAYNTPDEGLKTTRGTTGQLAFLKAGTTEQPVLKKKGDDLRIDWGWLYVAAPTEKGLQQTIRQSDQAASTLLCTSFPSVTVSDDPVVKLALVAYDEIYSVEFFHQKLQPWWRTHPETGGKKDNHGKPFAYRLSRLRPCPLPL